jgi:hypothetical protein
MENRIFSFEDLPEINRQIGLADLQERLVALYRISRMLDPTTDVKLLHEIGRVEQSILSEAAIKRGVLRHLGFF